MNLVINGRLITRDTEGKGYYEHGAVAYEGSKIVEVGEESALSRKYPDAHCIDARGGVIMPALINAHTHIYSALARGLSIVGNNPTNFYEVLDGTWWAIDRKLMMDGTRASATALYMDSIKQGVTTIFDHHASYGEIPGTLHTIAEESKRLGLRSCLCYEVSDRDGEEKCLQAIQENADFITECEKNKDPMLAAMFGGHALFTISDKTFDRMVEANNGRTGYHIHVSEGMNDVYDSLQNYGRRPIQRLQDHGILGDKTILGHCIHVNTAEMEIIQHTNTMVVNNPESNMGNAIGICPVLQLHKRGILLGMGTDAYTNDMLESIKVALCSQRSQNCLPNVGWCEVTDMLKNVLIVVDDIEKSIEFYKDLFGLQVILKNEGNVILSEGLVLQDADVWGKTLNETSTPFNNMMELYFEDFDIDGLLAKYESGKYFVRYATELTELAGGQKLVRLYDPSGNLIEVRTPFMSN